MQTLLLRLTAPLQSWGVQSRFSIRDTLREPTKSGVIGLLCAALGRPRTADISDLAALRMGVRVDREGQIRRDFHTAQHVVKASAKIKPGKPVSRGALKDTEPSVRHFLADAWFTVGLSSPDSALLTQLDDALLKPVWSLYLGRKSFVPSLPISWRSTNMPSGIVDLDLEEALLTCSDPLFQVQKGSSPIRFILEDEPQHAALRVVSKRQQPDHPLSFQPRRFMPRLVSVALKTTSAS